MRVTYIMSGEDYYLPGNMDFGETFDHYSMSVIQNCCVHNLCSNITFNISCGEYVYVDQHVSFWQVSYLHFMGSNLKDTVIFLINVYS